MVAPMIINTRTNWVNYSHNWLDVRCGAHVMLTVDNSRGAAASRAAQTGSRHSSIIAVMHTIVDIPFLGHMCSTTASMT